MFVLIQHSVATGLSAVVAVFDDELNAQSRYLEHIGTLTGGKESLVAEHVSACEARLYRRSVGWIYSAKELAYTLQLVSVVGNLAE